MAREQRTTDLVFDFIKSYIAEHGWAPTIREICEATGLKSTSNGLYHLRALEKQGRIERGTHAESRTIRIVEQDES